MDTITSFLKTGKPGRKQTYQNLTIFPLLGPGSGTRPDYLTLEQALDRNRVQITEMDPAGSVPELRLLNQGEKNVLIVEGEELVGAKQNRIVNSTFLVAGKTEVVLPVSCVEQGRWHYKSDTFTSGKRMMHPSLRRQHQADVKYSLNRGEGYRSNQGRIWENIAEKSSRMQVNTPTHAISDVFESYDDRLSEYLKAFRPMEMQTGAVFAINGEILGLECFGYADTFARFFEKLVKSYALDAIDSPGPAGRKSVPPDAARRFVESVWQSKHQRHRSLGLGENMTFDSRSVSGTALVERKRVLHLSAFKKKHGTSVRYTRYSRRRDRRID